MTAATGNFYCGLYEFGDMAFVLHFLREEDTFVDIGANIGSFTVLASGVVGANSIAIEPVPVTYSQLLRNIKLNNIESKVDAQRIVAGRESGAIRFSVDAGTVNKVVGEEYPGKTESIEMMPLDQVLDGKSPSLWKVDVEGFEIEVLTGATHVLQNRFLQAVLLEAESDEIRNVMAQNGFTLCDYDPFQRRVIPLTLVTHSRNDRSCLTNHLWVRDVEAVNQRCQAAKRFQVLGVEF
jgi:FkbM family methyltransferase